MPQVTATSHNYNAFDLASQWLTALGWPNTPSNQRAFAAWFLSESGHSSAMVHGTHVIGNNPLNITTSSGNYRLVGSHKIAVYSTPQEGVAAFGNLIQSPNHHYPGIQTGFKTGNGANAVAAIINSGWVTGGNGPSYWHTVGGQKSNLIQNVYNGLPGGGSVSVMPPSSGQGTPVVFKGTVAPSFLSDPTHVITDQDIADWKAWLLSNSGLDVSSDTYQKLSHYFDTVFTPTNLGSYQVKGQTVQQVKEHFGSSGSKLFAGITPSDVAGFNKDPITGLTDVISGALGGFMAKIGYALALFAGAGLTAFGLYLITKEAINPGSTSAQSIVSPVPVFIKEHV